jgi:hypothetical protein
MIAVSSKLNIRPVATAVERGQWDALAARSPVGHRHQCMWWMEPLAHYGFETRVLGCWHQGELVGGALFRSYRVPYTGTVVSECLDGPIFLEWESEWAEELFDAVEDMAGQVNSLAVAIRDCPDEKVHRDILQVMRKRGLHVALTPGAADAVLPLQGRTLEQVRAEFNRGTRARIRKSQTGGMSIRRLTSPEELAQAYAAWIASANRKGFTDVRPWAGLEPVIRHCLDHKLGVVLGSYAEGKLQAAAFIVHVGSTAAYVYGGYVDGAEKFSPTHLLQYEALRESYEKGLVSYNFGNLLGEYQPSARGVDEFKLGFGAAPVRHLETIVWKRKMVLYDAIELVRRARVGRNLEAMFRSRLIRRGENVRITLDGSSA